MQFSVVSLTLALVSAQEYSRPSACRSFANGLIQDCGSLADAFHIKDVILTPPVPVAGQPLDVHLIGHLSKEIAEGSTTTLSANVNGAQYGNIDLNICELAKARALPVQCPVKPMHVDMHHTLDIPANAPKGVYFIKAHGFNQDNVRIFNITLQHTSKGYQA